MFTSDKQAMIYTTAGAGPTLGVGWAQTDAFTSAIWTRLAEPLWTDPGLKSGISVRKLIST